MFLCALLVAFTVSVLAAVCQSLKYASNSTHINIRQIFSSVQRSVASQSKYI